MEIKAIVIPSDFPVQTQADALPWKNPDPKEIPYVVITTEHYNAMQKVFDDFECRQAIRDTGAIVFTAPKEVVISLDPELSANPAGFISCTKSHKPN